MTRISRIIIYILLSLGLVFTLSPFVYMISTSLTKDSYAMPYPPNILPKSFYYQNYLKVWTSNHFGRYFLNSAMISFITMITNLLISSMTAYGFAKFNFKGKSIIFKLFIFSMMVPGILNIIPQYTVLKGFQLIDSYIGLIMLYVGSGIAGNTFFLRSFFESIPRELEESITVDGGGKWTIFFNIIIPLSAPALGTFAIFAFSGAWDEFFAALTLIKSEHKRTLPIALRLFEGKHASDYGLIFAASLIAILPIIVIFIIFQDKLVRGGIAEGAIKS